VKPGDLFFALKGDRFDGNEYIDRALQSGAFWAVSDRADMINKANVTVAENSLDALQSLATFHRRKLEYPIIALTGSNGKTTSKELIQAVLSSKYASQCTQGNLNNHIGVPLTLLRFKLDQEVGIVEMGANHQGEIAQLCDISLPDLGLITNIGMAHLEGFGGLMGVRKGKGEMYDYLKEDAGTIYVNHSEQFLSEMIGDYRKVIGYDDSSLLLDDKKYEWRDISHEYACVQINHGAETYHIRTQLAGSHNYRNIIQAVVVGLHFELKLEEIVRALDGFRLRMNRSEIVEFGNVLYIKDAYNANPSSVNLALSQLKSSSKEKKAVVLGDMLELGMESEYQHRAILEELNTMKDLKKAILIGPEYGRFRDDYPFHFFDSVEDAMMVRTQFNEGLDICLLKGSNSMKLEKWLDAV